MKHIVYCLCWSASIISFTCKAFPDSAVKYSKAVVIRNMYAFYKHAQTLYDAIDPFTEYAASSVYPTLKEIQRVDSTLYALLQDVYNALKRRVGEPDQLSNFPIFAVLQDDRVKNMILYGTETGHVDAASRKIARRRFRTMAKVVIHMKVRPEHIPRTSEEYDVQAALALLANNDTNWWSDSLDYFRRTARGEYVDQAADRIDAMLQDIDMRIPPVFIFHQFPEFLRNLARQENAYIRQAIVEDEVARQEVRMAIVEQIQQLQEQSVEQVSDQKKEGLLRSIRSGTQLRRAGPSYTRWWSDDMASFQKRMQENVRKGALSQSTLDAFMRNVHRILAGISAKQGSPTQWFINNIFQQFLTFMEDEDLLEQFIQDQNARERIEQALASLWRISSQDDPNITLSQLRKIRNFKSRGRFVDGFAFDA